MFADESLRKIITCTNFLMWFRMWDFNATRYLNQR